jgi:hypothetical protein
MFATAELFMYKMMMFGANGAASIIGDGAKKACPVDAKGVSQCGVANINNLFSSVSRLLLFIIGAIAILMIIIGGLRYVLSAGDPKATASAKDTILYAVVGLVIAASAYAIVSFVTGHI